MTGQTLFELRSRATAKGLGKSRQAVSQHLDVLEQAGLVNTLQDGRYKFHHLDTAPLDEIDPALEGAPAHEGPP